MTFGWQDAAVFAAVTAALGYLGRGMIQLARRQGFSGCACCPKCSLEKRARPLVTIKSPSHDQDRAKQAHPLTP